MKDQPHDQRHQQRIGKENGRGNASIHILIAKEQQQRRGAEDDAHQRHREELSSTKTKALSLQSHHHSHHQNSENVTEEKHRVSRHAISIQRQCEQGIQTVAGSCDTPECDSFDLDVHNLWLCIIINKSADGSLTDGTEFLHLIDLHSALLHGTIDALTLIATALIYTNFCS